MNSRYIQTFTILLLLLLSILACISPSKSSSDFVASLEGELTFVEFPASGNRRTGGPVSEKFMVSGKWHMLDFSGDTVEKKQMDEAEFGIFSPDGAWKFLFVKEEDTNNDGVINEKDRSSLYLLEVGSSEKRRINLPFPVGICAWGTKEMIAACSFASSNVNPNGNTNMGDNSIVYLVNLETGELLQRLSDPTKSSWALKWSPNGSMLAFEVGTRTERGLEIGGIQVVDVQTGELIYEILEPMANEPVWSPDSTQLAFVANLEAGEYTGMEIKGMYRDVFYVDLSNKSSTIVNVTRTSRFSEIPATLTHLGGIWVSDPVWSPDGKVIASVWGRDRDEQIWVTSVDGDEWARLADGSEYYLREWRP